MAHQCDNLLRIKSGGYAMSRTDKRVEWKARYDAWRESGLSVARWCREQGLKDYQMYYWIQKFEGNPMPSEKQDSKTQWLAVHIDEKNRNKNEEAVFIHFDSITVEVRSGVNMSLLSDIVSVLQNQC